MPKELKEHKTINNKDGIKLSLHALGVGCVPSLRVGEKDPKYDQYQRSYNPTPKVYYPVSYTHLTLPTNREV